MTRQQPDAFLRCRQEAEHLPSLQLSLVVSKQEIGPLHLRISEASNYKKQTYQSHQQPQNVLHKPELQSCCALYGSDIYLKMLLNLPHMPPLPAAAGAPSSFVCRSAAAGDMFNTTHPSAWTPYPNIAGKPKQKSCTFKHNGRNKRRATLTSSHLLDSGRRHGLPAQASEQHTWILLTCFEIPEGHLGRRERSV